MLLPTFTQLSCSLVMIKLCLDVQLLVLCVDCVAPWKWVIKLFPPHYTKHLKNN